MSLYPTLVSYEVISTSSGDSYTPGLVLLLGYAFTMEPIELRIFTGGGVFAVTPARPGGDGYDDGSRAELHPFPLLALTLSWRWTPPEKD